MLSSVVPKRSTSDDVEGVPCGTSEMFPNIRLVVSAVNRDQTSTIAQKPDSSGAQAGSTPAGRAERTVEAERRALTPPSTA